VLPRCLQLHGGHRRDEGQRVDLAVRVVEGDADLLALVLEDEDVLELGPRAERLVAIGPDVDEQADALDGELRQRLVVVGGVDDHLASRRQGRKPVLEDHHLEVVERDLRVALGAGGAQRAEAGGKEGPVVPLGVVRDPLLAERVEAELRHLFGGCTRGGSVRPSA